MRIAQPLPCPPTKACRAYHMSRMGFFMVQGLASLLASRAVNGSTEGSPILPSRWGTCCLCCPTGGVVHSG